MFILKLSCKSIACSLLIFNVKHELKAGEKITPIQKITLCSKELSVSFRDNSDPSIWPLRGTSYFFYQISVSLGFSEGLPPFA